MLIDPLSLRCAATGLATTATDLRAQCAALTSTAGQVRWAASLVDDVRRRLAQAEADCLTGCRGLDDGAAHLRALAGAVEDLQAACTRLHTTAVADLQTELAAARPGMEADVVRRALAAVAAPDDPYWARAAAVAPVALPTLDAARPVPVPDSPPGLVEADLDGVQGLVSTLGTTVSAVRAAAAGVRARVGDLALERLDSYLLAGSRSAAYLSGLTSPLDAAISGWTSSARTAALLAELLALVDNDAALLAEPRLPLALEVLAALRSGPEALRAALQPLSTQDVAWLVDVVPGLAGPAPAPVAPSVAPGPVDLLDALLRLWQVPVDAADRLRRDVADLTRQARRLRAGARRLGAALAAPLRAAAADVLAAARSLSERAQRIEGLASHLHVPRWLRRVTDVPLVDIPVLRHLDRLGAVGTVIGIFLDLRDGDSLPTALAKAATGLVAGAVAGALAAGLVAMGLVALPELAAGVFVVVVSSAASWAAVRYGPALWVQVARLGHATGRLAGSAGHAIGGAARQVARTASSAAGGLGRIGRSMLDPRAWGARGGVRSRTSTRKPAPVAVPGASPSRVGPPAVPGASPSPAGPPAAAWSSARSWSATAWSRARSSAATWSAHRSGTPAPAARQGLRAA